MTWTAAKILTDEERTSLFRLDAIIARYGQIGELQQTSSPKGSTTLSQTSSENQDRTALKLCQYHSKYKLRDKAQENSQCEQIDKGGLL